MSPAHTGRGGRTLPWRSVLAVAGAAATAVVVAPLAAAQSGDGIVLDRERAADLAQALSDAPRLGADIVSGGVVPDVVPPGRAASVRVALGPDPLGLARSLRVSPPGFWGSAGAELVASGPGFVVRAPIAADGSAVLSFTPAAVGAVRVRMLVPGRAVRFALDPPIDLVRSLQPFSRFLGPTWGRITGSPVRWAVGAPVQIAGTGRHSPIVRVIPEPTEPTEPPVPGPEPEPQPVPAPQPGPEPQPTPAVSTPL